MSIDFSRKKWQNWPKPARLRLLTLLRRRNARRPPEPLLEWAVRYLPHYFSLPPSHMHLWLFRRLQQLEPGARLAIIAPRNSAKSTLLSFAFPLYCAVTQRQPYILLVAETADQARRYLQSLERELTGNERLRRDFPEACGQGSPWNADRLVLQNGVEIEALGTGASIRGRKNAHVRPTLVVVDDPQDRKHVSSAALRAAQWTWFTQDVLNVGGTDTIYVAAGTALHRDALIDRLMRRPGWEARRFPAIEQWPVNMQLWQAWERLYTDWSDPNRDRRALAFYRQHQVQMDAGARVCWPQREDLYALMKLRVDIGRAAFESEKQGHPLNPELCEWPVHYFGDFLWFDEWPRELKVRTMALDPSKGADSRIGDYAALVVLGIDAAGCLYVEADLARRPLEETIQQCVAWQRQFQPAAFGCEATAWQELLCDELQAEFLRHGLLTACVCPLQNHEPKTVRIRRLGPFLSQRRLRFKSGSSGTALLVEQLQDFPLGEHDDGPDALEMALRLAAELLAVPREDIAGRLTRE